VSWDESDRRERLPDNWPELVVAVKRRAGGQCQWKLPKTGKRCPRRGTDVDHRVPGDDHSMSNLQLLCPHHHGMKSSAEGRAAKRAKKQSRYRPSEEHPGTLG
jgi:5-methylcytosine-specific restriction protein A